MVKNPPAMQETWGQLPASVFWLRQRSLAGYSPWNCKKSDTTERIHEDISTKLKKKEKILSISTVVILNKGHFN